ncbi:sialic acid-binding Ig-like lectin 13 isoform X2 [Puntigrus tetrazona]|uniref:sialic acid-binding Ig-like lectin 13 isoform X2 n=1 Tax=Puntigrus tetrazona TaxID=1606681 RepID=UPI001C8A496D|nr:sialic acid-binding Ig-like lectin 13 isoform X2 [Puntigrus tetrazona]
MVCPALLLQSFIWISLMAEGVRCDVTHIVSRMCVVRQSTALIPCKHTSGREKGSAAAWLFEKPPGQRRRVSEDPAFEGRVEFVPPDAGNCSMLLRDVRESDSGIFRFVLSAASGQNWTNDQGIKLEVTGVELEVKTESDVVMVGDLVLFVCGSCIPSMNLPTYIWRKDSHVHSQHHGENMLVLESVEPEDGGRYSCTISSHTVNYTSAEITLRPKYPPRSVRVSVSPSAEVVEGDSVTLICSSDSNPPALNFSWFKENQSSAVGSEQSLIISSFNSSHSGLYYCVQKTALYAAAGVGAGIVCICIITVVIKIIRKRVTPSGSGRSKPLESPEDAYMSLEPKSRCSEYDTLDNMKRSCENTEQPEDQEATYEDI